LRTGDEVQPAPRDREWSIGLTALLVAPLIVSAVYLWFAVGDAYWPGTDWALFELQTRDAWRHVLTVGPYSRYGWNHPGPLLFYVLAIPYKLSGDRSISMHITALIVNGAAITGIAWVAFRRGRLPMVVATLIPVGLLTHALGADLLRDPWNPYLPVIPLLLLLLLCWSVAVGDLWMLPIAVGVASFEIQLHVGLAVESVALLLLAVIAIVIRGVRAPETERSRWWGRVAKVSGISFIVLFTLWLPVLYGTLVRGDGNIEKILDFFQSPHRRAGYSKAIRALGLQWGAWPEWIAGPRGNSVIGELRTEAHWWLALGLALGVGSTVVAWRRRSWTTVWLAAFIVVGFGTAILAVSNVVDVLFPYLIRWTWVLGAALGILVLRGLWLVTPPDRRLAALRWLAPGAAIVLVALSAIETVDALTAGTPYSSNQAPERTIAREVLANLPLGPGTVLIDDSHGLGPALGIVLALERRGIPAAVVPSRPVLLGDQRGAGPGPYRAGLVVVSGAAVETVSPGRRIAHFERRWSRDERERLGRDLESARTLAPSKDRTTLITELKERLHRPAQAVSVYLVPADHVLQAEATPTSG
jgi:hypothetical protein